jgi:hypothetical protein
MATPTGTPVYCNVYNLIPSANGGAKLGNDALEFIKMGVYHAGIEVLGSEWSFGMSSDAANDPNVDGVFSVRPRKAVGEFKEAVLLGHINPPLTPEKVQSVLDSLRPQWKAATYHLLNRNCCLFSHAFALALNPEFDRTFPHQIYRAAGVGSKVLPDSAVASLTAALAPPPATPSHLIGKLDVPWSGPVPPPGPRKGGAPPPAAAPAPSSGFGGLMGMAKGAVSSVTNVVKSVADDRERSALTKAFPSIPAASLLAAFEGHVLHVFREQNATLFVTERSLAISGDNRLAVSLAYENIASLHYGRRVPPTVKGLQPTFVVESQDVGGADAGLFVFLKDGKLIPIFDFTTFGSTVAGTIGKVIPGMTVSTSLEKFFVALDGAWRQVARI